MSAGNSRHRADLHIPNHSPKNLWIYPLRPDAKKILCSPGLPPAHAKALTTEKAGTLPVTEKHMLNLCELLAQVPDPRSRNTRYKIGPVLTIVCMAMLAGRRDIAQINRFGQSLQQNQRRALCLPRKPNTRFWQVPDYNVYYHLLSRIDPDALARLLSDWLQARAGQLPDSLAMDGKMIRRHIGTLTLSSHEDKAPRAMAIYDQKEGTQRCELKAAQSLIQTIATLEGKTITADALHCQKQTARLIVERGGDYLLQVKGNQPQLENTCQTLAAQHPGDPYA
jgi:hypothetical protein